METKSFIILGIGIAMMIGVLAVFFASGDPDGLESTALVIQGDKTLTGETPPNAQVKVDSSYGFSYDSPLPAYSMGTGWGKPGEAIAIITGILLAFCAVFGASKLVTKLKKKIRTRDRKPHEQIFGGNNRCSGGFESLTGFGTTFTRSFPLIFARIKPGKSTNLSRRLFRISEWMVMSM